MWHLAETLWERRGAGSSAGTTVKDDDFRTGNVGKPKAGLLWDSTFRDQKETDDSDAPENTLPCPPCLTRTTEEKRASELASPARRTCGVASLETMFLTSVDMMLPAAGNEEGFDMVTPEAGSLPVTTAPLGSPTLPRLIASQFLAPTRGMRAPQSVDCLPSSITLTLAVETANILERVGG